MSRAVLYMSMSLDGYIAGPNDAPGNPGGGDFMRLHDWYGFASHAGPTAQTVGPSGIGTDFWKKSRTRCRPLRSQLSGRDTVEQVDHWGGDHHGGVPIFVPSHRPPQTVGG